MSLFLYYLCDIYFFMYSVLFPEMVTEMFETIYASPELSSVPGDVSDMLLKIEDNFAKYSCIATFIWNFILGIIFSAIISRAIKPKNFFAEGDNIR